MCAVCAAEFTIMRACLLLCPAHHAEIFIPLSYRPKPDQKHELARAAWLGFAGRAVFV